MTYVQPCLSFNLLFYELNLLYMITAKRKTICDAKILLRPVNNKRNHRDKTNRKAESTLLNALSLPVCFIA